MSDRAEGRAGPVTAAPGPYELQRGASWLLPGGEVIPVPGFHEEWLAEHAELAAGSHNVCELVLRRHWVSVALFDRGYLELIVPNRGPDIRRMILELLSRNAGLWARALVMSMGEEGYAMLLPPDAADEASLAAGLARKI
jgi:hypothetical protein